MLQSPTPEATAAPADTPADGVVASTETIVTPAVAAPVAPVRPEGLADDFWDATAGVKTDAVLAKLTEYQTAEAARAGQVPADVTGYKLETVEPILDLAGNPVSFNADDPLARGALEVLHKHGVGQAAASDLLAAYASSVIAEAKATNDAIAAEMAKLGANGPARVAAVQSALTAHAPAQAEAIMAGLSTADAVAGLETLISKLTGAGIAAAPISKADPFEGLTGAALIEAHRSAQAAGRAA